MKLMPHLLQRLHEFDKLRKERATLSRQVKQAEMERKALERRFHGSKPQSPETKTAAAAATITSHTRGMLDRKRTAKLNLGD